MRKFKLRNPDNIKVFRWDELEKVQSEIPDGMHFEHQEFDVVLSRANGGGRHFSVSGGIPFRIYPGGDSVVVVGDAFLTLHNDLVDKLLIEDKPKSKSIFPPFPPSGAMARVRNMPDGSTMFGKGVWKTICSFESANKSQKKKTTAMQIDEVGCVIKTKVTALGTYSEEMVFVPGVKIWEGTEKKEGEDFATVVSRKIVKI